MLCKRMRDGKQMCQDFEDFVRQRYVAGTSRHLYKQMLLLLEN